MTQHVTQLNAEDGTYFKKHATREDAISYAADMVGNEDARDCGDGEISFRDGRGRTIWIAPCSDKQYDAMVTNEVRYGRFVQES